MRGDLNDKRQGKSGGPKSRPPEERSGGETKEDSKPGSNAESDVVPDDDPNGDPNGDPEDELNGAPAAGAAGARGDEGGGARKITPRTFRGTRDFLPAEMIRREELFAYLRRVFQRYGFAPLETPAVEYMEILLGKYGREGEKLIYPLAYKGGRPWPCATT